MSKKFQLQERNTNEDIYPITTSECVIGLDDTIKEVVEPDLSNIIGEVIVDDETAPEISKMTVDTLRGEMFTDSPTIVIEKDKLNVTDEAKKKLFIDMWNDACKFHVAQGGYNSDTGYFYLNGLYDITFAQASYILSIAPLSRIQGPTDFAVRRFRNCSARTVFPINYYNVYSSVSSGDGMFADAFNGYTLESVVFYPEWTNQNFNSRANMFSGQRKLRIVKGLCFYGSCSTSYMFENCESLETVEINNLVCSISFAKCPRVTYDSFNYMITNAKRYSSPNPEFTITVHPNVYQALQGEAEYPFNGGTQEQWTKLMEDAIAKNITFASA